MPVISIIVPIYQPPLKYLKKCLESIMYQELKEIEIILILDGSGNDILQLVKEYQKKDNRIKYFVQENMGESISRNNAIQLATTDWICFVDADDWIEKNTLSFLYNKIKEENKVDIIIYDCIVEYKNKSIKNCFYPKEGELSKKDIEEIQLQNIGKGETLYFPNECNVSVVWAKIYKKKFLLENNLQFIPKIKRMPDAIFNLEALEKAKKIIHYNYYGYHYRKNKNSITQKSNDIKDFERFLNEVDTYIKKYNKGQRFKNTYYRAILTVLNMYLEANIEENMQQELEELMDKQQFKQLDNIAVQKLNFYQKQILKNLKNKNWNKIKFWIKIKKQIKSILKEEEKLEPKIEILVSIMNLQTENEVNTYIQKNKIKSNVLFINQIDENEKQIKVEKEGIRLYSYKEKGVSKSRNQAINNANADICLLSDDDTSYVEDYKTIVKNAYEKYPKADMIIFFAENKNKQREKIKKIRKGKIYYIDIMKARTCEISFKLDKIRKAGIKFNENFGPGGEIIKGEETVFLKDCLKKKLNIISVPIKIVMVEDEKSTWFSGYNEKFFLDQGAIFYEISPKFYKILVLQFVLRKREIYKNNFSLRQLYNIMKTGAEEYKNNKK